MEGEDRIRRMGVRTGAAGSAPTGPRQTPSDIVDRVMDPYGEHAEQKRREERDRNG